MIGFHGKLRGLYAGIEALYQTRSGLDPVELLVELDDDEPGSTPGPRELLVLREAEDGALEVALAFDKATLEHLEDCNLGATLDGDGLGQTLPVIEGLSHLAYVAEAARTECPLSALELETQAEVDKLAICLLHRWPQARDEFRVLVDRLYYRFDLVHDAPELKHRYLTANRIAAGFAHTLSPHVEARRLPELRRELRRFWRAPMARKRALCQ